MTIEELEAFITTEMKMSHVYQPVMLIELLKSPSGADVETIAKAILGHDQPQIEYYRERVKRMVGQVLSGNRGVAKKVEAPGGRIWGYRLALQHDLSDCERQRLISLCESKIGEFEKNNAGAAWKDRTRNERYVPGSIRYDVLRRANGLCELCGISNDEAPLQVDHIIPKTWGGEDEISNFQALCSTCNANKGNRDDTDFRGLAQMYEARQSGCFFCEIDDNRIVAQNARAVAFLDKFPVTPGHTLIVPRRHVSDYFDLHQPELNAIQQLINEQRTALLENDGSISGFNVGINSGQSAGQTIFHCHVHLIPRRNGDTDDPAGGVRGVIPGKQSY